MRYLSSWLVLGTLLLAVGCCVQGCDNLNPPTTTEPPKPVVLPVEAGLPTRGEISSYLVTNSRVTAEIVIEVTPEMVEKCTAINVEEGDRVTKGQILAELDKKDMQSQIEEAESQVRTQRIQCERAKKLADEGLGPKADYDTAKLNLDQAESQLKRLKLQLSDLTIRSPITGIVTSRELQVGQLVSSGQPIFRIVDPTSYMLIINPPEQQLANLKVGQTAEVTIDAIKNEVFEARVRKINPNVDPASGTVKVTLDFDQETMTRLRDQAFARVKLVLETHSNALLVPKDVVVEENARKYLFILSDEDGNPVKTSGGTEGGSSEEDSATAADADQEETFIAKRVEIETGLEDSDFVEILSGVDEDTRIITLGQQNLKPGTRVRVTNAEAELRSKAGLSAEEALAAAEAERESGAAEGQETDGSGRRRMRRAAR